MAMNSLVAVQNVFGSLVTATVEVPLVAVIGVFFVGLLFGWPMSR